MRWIRRLIIARTLRRLLRDGAREWVEDRREERAEEELQAETARHLQKLMMRDAFAAIAAMSDPFGLQEVKPHSPAPAVPPEPGRQPGLVRFSRPFPAHASSMAWEDLHQFGGRKPQRDPHFGLHGGDPAISMTCPGCDVLMEPFTEFQRRCGYCGIRMHRSGGTVFWWRDPVDVPVWEPKR